MSDVSTFGMSIALGRPEQCHEDVTRRGDSEPCDKPAVALRIDPEEGEPYPVCARHARADMVTLEQIVRFFLDRREAERRAAAGLIRLATDREDRRHPDWYDTHCPTCDAPEPTHTATCAVVHPNREVGGTHAGAH